MTLPTKLSHHTHRTQTGTRRQEKKKFAPPDTGMGTSLTRKTESLVRLSASSVLVTVLIPGLCTGGVYENSHGLSIDPVFSVILREGLRGAVLHPETALRPKKLQSGGFKL